MIREVIRPSDTHLTINIPKEYVGKTIEYIVFPVHEQTKDPKDNKLDIDSVGGMLRQYADPSKIPLEENAWELHVLDKFGK